MGVTEDAAKMRVNRGLEKLRNYFSKRAVVSTTAIIATAISGNSVQAAPIGLAGTVTATAAKGAAVTASTSTLVNGTLKIMAWSKMKTAGAVAFAAVLVGGVTTVALSQTHHGSDTDAKRIVQETIDAYAALTSYSDSGTVVTTGGGSGTRTTFTIRLKRPNFYRIEWNQTGGAFNAGGKTWNDGTGNYFQVDGRAGPGKPQKMQSMQLALGMATGVSSSAASTIPSVFFNEGWGNQLGAALSDRAALSKDKDDNVDGVDCFVVTSKMDMSKLAKGNNFAAKIASQAGKTKTTFWIGKQDHLVRQVRSVMVSNGGEIKLTDGDLAEMLRAQNKPVTPKAIAELRTNMEGMTAIKSNGVWRISSKPKLSRSGEFVSTQTHENIQVNQKFTDADFK